MIGERNPNPLPDLAQRAPVAISFALPPLDAPTLDHTALGLILETVETLLTTHESTLATSPYPLTTRDRLLFMARIQPCRCTHGKSIHHAKRVKKKLQNRCGFPNCKCREYKPKD
jgi:hypothetical protein